MTTNIPGMESTIAALLAPGKGILAADESFPTIQKRFKQLGIPSTFENRRSYREMLFATPGLSEFISGAILFDETIFQRTGSALPMVDLLTQTGIVPGIKVDLGAVELCNFASEKITEGLDGLTARLLPYRHLGARFTKWRAVISIGDGRPSPTCIQANAHVLARFAALSQASGLVPIVEPEVLMAGSHTLGECEAVTNVVLDSVFQALADHRVVLERILLKTGMVVSGQDCPQPASVSELAAATLRSLRRSVPEAVPGIVFLSGGQSDVAATVHLNAICQNASVPWKLTFSFGRALQDAALQTWRGVAGNLLAPQAALRHRARCNSLAVAGKYSAELEAQTQAAPAPL